jgi:DNA polymerase-3 subunit delta
MPPKKDDGAALKQLKQSLKENTIGQLYLFHGEEAYLRDFYLNEIKKRVLTPGLEEFNLHTIQGKNASPRSIAEAVDCLPMMSERTLVLVTDYDLFRAPADHRDALIALFAQLPEYVCLVFVYDLIEYKPDARTKLAQALNAHGLTVPFPHQEQGDLVDWICRRFRALDHDIDSEQARYLIFLCGDLMNSLVGEISKIGAYAKQRRITRQDIDAVAVPQLDARVFQMTDAVLNRKFDQAAQVLGDLLGQQEAPIMILSVLGKQLRQLYTARLGFEAHRSSQYLVDLWKMKPYPAGKLMDAARRFDLNWCRRAVVRAAQTDLVMKSTGADAGELLTGFLLELAHG